MGRIEINTIEALQASFDDFYFDYQKPFLFENYDFNFDLLINFRMFHKLKHPTDNGSNATQFSSIKHYIFKNCKFRHELKLFVETDIKLTFEKKCEFYNLDFSEATINQKIRFYNCKFFGSCNFENTKFKDLVDFWHSEFMKPINFYKTDFKGIAVFSACKFYQNTLFTYSSFNSSAIFRGATFKQGLDVSLAIFNSDYNFFEVSLSDYKSEITNSEIEYNNVIESNKVPTINKRETFRILKTHFQEIGDDLGYVKFLKLEKKPIHQILVHNFKKTPISDIKEKATLLFDLISLQLNKWSNDNRNSYFQGLIFTLIVGLVFVVLSIISLPVYQLQINPLKWDFPNFFTVYVKFMNPTHDVDLFEDYNPTGFTYFWQTLGRIFVGYGIYQTVQAFRKLK
jgi:hypothetical protein